MNLRIITLLLIIANVAYAQSSSATPPPAPPAPTHIAPAPLAPPAPAPAPPAPVATPSFGATPAPSTNIAADTAANAAATAPIAEAPAATPTPAPEPVAVEPTPAAPVASESEQPHSGKIALIASEVKTWICTKDAWQLGTNLQYINVPSSPSTNFWAFEFQGLRQVFTKGLYIGPRLSLPIGHKNISGAGLEGVVSYDVIDKGTLFRLSPTASVGAVHFSRDDLDAGTHWELNQYVSAGVNLTSYFVNLNARIGSRSSYVLTQDGNPSRTYGIDYSFGFGLNFRL